MSTLIKSKVELTQKWNANKYHQNSSIQFEASKKVLKNISLRGDESILDVGCGDGKITVAISSYIPNGEILGIDSSSKMIEFANGKFSPTQHPNVSFLLQDGASLSFENKFDIVFSSFTLQWISDFASFMKKANLALRDQGKIVFTIPLGISSPLEQATEEFRKSPVWDKYFLDFKEPQRFSSSTEYEEMILSAGFEITSLEVVPVKKIFDSRDSFESYVIQWYSYINYIDADLREQFFNEIVNRYLEIEPCSSTGKITFEFPRIDIVATKK